ncbi:MAG TPA: DUF2203 domain-containing protein [Candidatus Thermoplasmatota archaeon]|nr:DUF2203 domain-containing protein [Candidatus Thermoplasmatota archaeon]
MREFTAAEANALVPRVRPLLASLREAFHAFTFAREQWQELASFGQAEGDEGRRYEHEAEAGGAQVQRLIDELHALGCEVKDPTMGLVDFYGRRSNGELVLLCYRDDEDAIRFWHPLVGGFAGRRPLAEL